MGFTFSDTEIDEIREQTNENYKSDLEINDTYAEQLGVSKDDLVNIYVDVYIYGRTKAEYSAYVFDALLNGDIVSDNNDINELLTKMKGTPIEDYEDFGDDVLKITDWYLDYLLSASDFEILKTIE